MKRILLIVVLVVTGFAATRVWRSRVVAKLEERAFSHAVKLVRDGQPTDALAIADERPRTDLRFPWSRLELEAVVAARHIPRLVSLYGSDPGRVLAHEEASLLVARALFAARQRDDFDKLRAGWRGREARPELWLALDSDVLGLDGKPRDAEKLLRSRTFNGEAEATRLVRLALHSADRDLYGSWTLLDRAFGLAPRNPEVRSFRAQILESIHKTGEARVEHVAAHVADPKNPLLRDELAEFYRRQGAYDLALGTWRDALALPAPDFIAVKNAFWSRVIQPDPAPGSRRPVHGSLAPLADFIDSLPPGRAWDAETFGRLPQSDRFVRDRAEVFWLRLIELLRTGREKEAAELLQADRFRARSFRPELGTGLARILHFRVHRSLSAPDVASSPVGTNGHPFFQELERLAKAGARSGKPAPVPAELASFLGSSNAFSGAFLAAGWREAALGLGRPEAPGPVPAWFSFGFAQCLRFNRGNRPALEYLARQTSTPETLLLRGELMLAEKRFEEARRELGAVATHDSDAGFRAAWLLAQWSIESKEPDRARRIVQDQPRLASSVHGRELLARAALVTGKTADAERMYRAIEKDSVEARAFSARSAFGRQDWAAARRHTEALIRRMPDELQLRENLVAIAKAEGAHADR